MDSISDIESKVRGTIEQMVNQVYGNEGELVEYLCSDIKDIVVRIDTAVRTKQLDKLFVL